MPIDSFERLDNIAAAITDEANNIFADAKCRNPYLETSGVSFDEISSRHNKRGIVMKCLNKDDTLVSRIFFEVEVTEKETVTRISGESPTKSKFLASESLVLISSSGDTGIYERIALLELQYHAKRLIKELDMRPSLLNRIRLFFNRKPKRN